ncbi:DUF4396 domain-containing protein [Chthonobacter albigriseus]|uniref:DUF4396 domain-containing protein n=1 Tax=Chthonobacter albigriseus TaxID=1683161 RepID=UPI0015EE912F|nr:DUF4396 domain-containing protein [Chthonobacter albigriseus]
MTTDHLHAHHGHPAPAGEPAHHHSGHHGHGGADSLNRTAFLATLHCMTGCAIGEIAGMVIGTSLGWSMWETVALAVVLAFITGFALTMRPLLKGGIAFVPALKIAFAADFVSVTVMEIVDNAVMMSIPHAMHAGPTTLLFWGSMAVALAVAVVVVFPINRWMIARGKGHAVVHAYH